MNRTHPPQEFFSVPITPPTPPAMTGGRTPTKSEAGAGVGRRRPLPAAHGWSPCIADDLDTGHGRAVSTHGGQQADGGPQIQNWICLRMIICKSLISHTECRFSYARRDQSSPRKSAFREHRIAA